jgi:hypothetical protein
VFSFHTLDDVRVLLLAGLGLIWFGCVSEARSARSLDPTRRERPGHMKIERFGLSPFSATNILEFLQSVFGSRQGML